MAATTHFPPTHARNSDSIDAIKDNFAEVRARADAAARRAGRAPSEVAVVAVSKTVPLERLYGAAGAGIAELGYDAADRHLATTLEVIEGCRCTDGCPSCIQSPKCGNWNEPLDKAGAARLLRAVLHGR